MFHLKRYYILCIAFFVCILLNAHAFAQPQARGFGNAALAAASTSAGRTVALVVGVSDYPYVAPLNYAAEDALLMYDFLQTKAGGSVPKENIRLLINEEATSQNVWTRGLSWIKNSFMPRPSDHIIIYLAGHGDADEYNSYFLCHNANPAGDKNNYNWTDVLNIETLKKYIAGFSASGAEVILIMDACRSGDIPGARAGITNPFESVVERRAGETLMLSASANQLAVEDRRWGRGHGVFTWNLIQGLSGKADENGDGSIDFYEIEQYTKAKVRKETQAMGRMQVPQFAAAPSGGGALGRVDNAFLNKLSTEALSSVSVSESIAQARTAAESSWFTDSTLYAGFNELKKLVRDGKYLGKGSAEPIYTRLAEQFSADQIEPVRLYYMSALASAGFEAINQELLLNIGVTLTTKFYERRWAYLNKAYQLQRKPDEVYQLEQHRKLVEAIYLKRIKTNAYEGMEGFQFSNGMVDTLSSMKQTMGKTAAYYYWMREFNINPFTGKQGMISRVFYEYPDGSWNRINSDDAYNWLLDSCLVYAPAWPKVLTLYLSNATKDKWDSNMLNVVKGIIKLDSTNAEYWYVLSTYYSRHKPYDFYNWRKSIIKSVQFSPNSKSLLEIFDLSIFTLNNRNAFTVDEWLRSEMMKNFIHYKIDTNEFEIIHKACSILFDRSENDEYVFENKWNFSNALIQYYCLRGNVYRLRNLVAKDKDLENYDTQNLAILSSLFFDQPEYNHFLKSIDSVLQQEISNKERYFSNDQANLIAWRIISTEGIKEFEQSIRIQLKSLESYSYPHFRDELFFFKSRKLLETSGTEFTDVLADSMFQSCKRLPSDYNYELYASLLQKSGKKQQFKILLNDSILAQRSESTRSLIEAKYYILTNDTANLKSLIYKCSQLIVNESYYSVLAELNLNYPQYLEQISFALIKDTSYCELAMLLKYGMGIRASYLYDDLLSKDENATSTKKYCKSDLDIFRVYLVKNDFIAAANQLERIIDYVSSADVNWIRDIYNSSFVNYDAFIQSKEYKAMMARVYTAPEK